MDKRKLGVPLVCHGHSRPVVDLFYSPITPDGFFLISASKDSSPMLRNGETGDWIGTFEGHKGAVWSCCLDTNALRAASGSADFTAIWDALTGDELHLFEHKHIVRACALSEKLKSLLVQFRTAQWLHSDQTILSSCTDIGGVRLWDVRSGKIVQTLETKSSVTSAEVSQMVTSQLLMVLVFGLVRSFNMPSVVESASLEPKLGNKFIAGEKTWIRLFDFHTGEEIGYYLFCIFMQLAIKDIMDLYIVFDSHLGESYASGSEDGTIRIWHTTGHEDNDSSSTNGLITGNGKVKVTVDEVSRKIEGFHVSKDLTHLKRRKTISLWHDP
ncbi:hypothetical protein MKW92_012108 [Papaver armeniacum]|nr:hypothetical protein MKW92_012108 [Papaver armeniacum]